MLTGKPKQVASDAKQLFSEKIEKSLEESDQGKFICIEPESEQYFLGNTLHEAVNKAIDVYPDRLTHTLRVGHAAALHWGAMIK